MLKSLQTTLLFLIGFLTIHSIAAAKDSSGVAALKDRLTAEINQSTTASDKVKKFAVDVLLPEISNPAFSWAIREQNDKKISLEEIKKIDQQWKSQQTLPIKDRVMTNPCANKIRKLARRHLPIGEAFIMDNKGANVCQNELTSDYWQGDEPKWRNSFRNGKGGVNIGNKKLDESSNIVLQQISLPIVTQSGRVIGSVCYGIKTGKLIKTSSGLSKWLDWF